MAKGFQYREIKNFIELKISKTYTTTCQMSLSIPGIDGDDTIKSEIRYLGGSAHKDFYRYHVIHESEKPFCVRFDNIQRDSVILIDKFNLYVPINKTYVWADTNSKNCNELFKRIKNTEQSLRNKFLFEEREINLVAFINANMTEITGGHFNQLTIADVRAAALFGPHVGESEDWQRYENSGEISAVTAQVNFRNTSQRVMITRNGGIVVYSALSEGDNLELIEQINDWIGSFVVDLKN